MKKSATTSPLSDDPRGRRGDLAQPVMAVILLWSAEEPWRAGEVAFVPADGRELILGRDYEGEDAVRFFRQRPGELVETAPIRGRAISRRQLVITASEDALTIRRVGNCELAVNRKMTEEARVTEGDLVGLRGQLLLLVTRRPRKTFDTGVFPEEAVRPFGEADAYGIVGESFVAWELRDELAFAGQSVMPVLLSGASGTGKELAARAIHGLRQRRRDGFVSTAATPADKLTDEDLFGRAGDAGRGRATLGLVGEAEGGTLFIDHVDELQHDVLRRVRRMIEAGGEYRRVGETELRHSNARVIASTERTGKEIDPKLSQIFLVSIDVPPLAARREDIPLIARELVLRAAESDPESARRYVPLSTTGDPENESAGADAARRLEPRMEDTLIERLVRGPHDDNVRDVEERVWHAIQKCRAWDSLWWDEKLWAREDKSRLEQGENKGASAPGPSEEIRWASLVALPKATAWKDVTIRRHDGHTISVRVGRAHVCCSYVDLGMAAKNSRNPTNGWRMLIAMCDGRGSWKWSDFGDIKAVKTAMSRLRDSLQAAFGLDDDPFEVFSVRRGWTPRFVAMPEETD